MTMTMPETGTRKPLRPELSARQSVQVHALAGYRGVTASDFVRACVDAAILGYYQNDLVAQAMLDAINEAN